MKNTIFISCYPGRATGVARQMGCPVRFPRRREEFLSSTEGSDTEKSRFGN